MRINLIFAFGMPLLLSVVKGTPTRVPRGRVKIEGVRFLLDEFHSGYHGSSTFFTINASLPFNETRFRSSLELELLKIGNYTYVFKFPSTICDFTPPYLTLEGSRFGYGCLLAEELLKQDTRSLLHATAFQVIPTLDDQEGFLIREPATGLLLYRRQVHKGHRFDRKTPVFGQTVATTTPKYRYGDASLVWNFVAVDTSDTPKPREVDAENVPLVKHFKCPFGWSDEEKP